MIFQLRILTGDKVVLEELIDDLGLEKETPLLVLEIGLLRHSLCCRLLDHLFNSFRM